MDQETLNLIIGGAIGFLASFLVTVATFFFQNYQNKQKHTWDIDERYDLNRQTVLGRRLDQIEQEAANIIEWANTIFLQYPFYIKEGISEEKVNELTSGYLKNTNLVPNAIMLENKELEMAVKTFGTTSLDLYNWVAEGSFNNSKRNWQEVADIHDQLRQDYSYVLKCLDEYRVKKAVKP